MKTLALALLFTSQIEIPISPIQSCIIQWQEYEILVQYMLNHEYVDVQFIVIDQFMFVHALNIRKDYRYAYRAQVEFERGLIAFRYLLDIHDLARKIDAEVVNEIKNNK